MFHCFMGLDMTVAADCTAKMESVVDDVEYCRRFDAEGVFEGAFACVLTLCVERLPLASRHLNADVVHMAVAKGSGQQQC